MQIEVKVTYLFLKSSGIIAKIFSTYNKDLVMKKYCMLFLLIPLLCSCSYLDSRNATNPPTQREQLCSELKRNIIFNTASTPSMGAASPTQYAEMTRLYNKNNCDKT